MHDDIDKLKRSKEKLEAENVDLKEEMSHKDVLVDELNGIISSNQKQIAKFEGILKEQKISTDRVSKELEISFQKYQKLNAEHEHLQEENENNKKEVSMQHTEMKVILTYNRF